MCRLISTTVVLMCMGLLSAPVFAKPDVTRAALNRVLPTMSFDNVALGDAIDRLRELSGANIHVNWRALETISVTKDLPINVRVRAVPLRKVLALVLSETGAGDLLTFYTEDGVIEVTTRDIADRQLFTRVYPVGDLLMEIPDFEGPDLNLTSGTGNTGGRTGRGGGSGGGGGCANGGISSGNSGGQQEEAQTRTRTGRGDDLVELIKTTLQPDIWRDNGGTASIRFFKDNLIVTAPRSVHDALGGRRN